VLNAGGSAGLPAPLPDDERVATAGALLARREPRCSPGLTGNAASTTLRPR
jgi:hypothetical protein